jgi:hypothetical protein
MVRLEMRVIVALNLAGFAYDLGEIPITVPAPVSASFDDFWW